ncbi:hypothetical protein Pan97_28080 [Bremerella volcania]|uniref:Uncharacterized protein n=1 Tax=Bremerella volcania TaxID=2527984 RepID=A0A518C963_9BACT|nr:hypothetical protein Pan97_28080 [Bremerella volcania]
MSILVTENSDWTSCAKLQKVFARFNGGRPAAQWPDKETAEKRNISRLSSIFHWKRGKRLKLVVEYPEQGQVVYVRVAGFPFDQARGAGIDNGQDERFLIDRTVVVQHDDGDGERSGL